MTTISERATDERAHAVNRLREIFPAGSTVHTVLRHVSQSGMTRAISVIGTDVDGPRDVSWLVVRATSHNLDPRHEGIKVSGAGMDMGFHVVYGLSLTLHNDGYALSHRWL